MRSQSSQALLMAGTAGYEWLNDVSKIYLIMIQISRLSGLPEYFRIRSIVPEHLVRTDYWDW